MNENSKTLPNMSLTAFKALVGQQPVYVELVERYGARGDKIPEKLRGKRRIVKARSYGFDIAIAGSLYETSRLDIRRASLCKIADGYLTLFDSTQRKRQRWTTGVLSRTRMSSSAAPISTH